MSEIIDKIQDFAIEELMGDAFAEYAKYIIQDRAIPDVRDGLKPVQRRILYAMYKNNNTYDKPYSKSAQTVGEVIGKYHPHGDTSVYDALTRMSQEWKQRHLLIDFKGNNGSIDGDQAAAYRYTEARISRLSNELLKDLDKDTVIMAPTFDDKRLEPTVLPSRYPNLLVNGATGISAGYATNIPPHNLGEVIDATIKRIDNPNCRLDTIMEIVKGPDFPTGGTVYGKSGVRDAFETGRGKVVVRSTYEIIKKKGKSTVLITEIPFDVNKSTLVTKMTDILLDKKIEGIAAVSDLSDIDGLKIEVELKKGVDTNFIVNYLLKNTDLQATYNYNMVTIVNRRPKLLGILGILDAYIEHQKDVVTRRTKYDLAAKEKEFHILEGLVKALDIIDEIIKVIRSSKNKSDSKKNLINQFDFTEIQAEAIVTLQLYKLSNTDIEEVKMRIEQLTKEIKVLNSILESEEVLLKVIKHELRTIKKEFALPRKTQLEEHIEDIKIDVMKTIPKENVIVVVTNEGYIKRVSTKSYAASKDEPTTLKPGDYIKSLFEITTLDTIILFTNLGNYLYIPVHTIFEAKWKELGKHINNLITIAPEEKIIASYVFDKTKKLVFFTKNGVVKKSEFKNYEVARYSKPLLAIRLKKNDEVVNVCFDDENLMFVTENGYYLNFESSEVNEVGVKAGGVKGINLKEDIVINGFTLNKDSEYINIFTNNKTAKRIKVHELTTHSRANRGNLLMKKVKSVDYKITHAYITEARSEIGIKSDSEIRVLKNSDISIMDLNSTGSNISKYKIDDSFEITQLKSYLNTKKEEKNEPKEEKEKEYKEMTLDDFLDDFKI